MVDYWLFGVGTRSPSESAVVYVRLGREARSQIGTDILSIDWGLVN